jgi:hypothetical protein
VFAAGVRRIVTRRDCLSAESLRHMAATGVEFVKLEESPEVLAALEAASLPHVQEERRQGAVQEDRRKRKLVKAAWKEQCKNKKLMRRTEGDGDLDVSS